MNGTTGPFSRSLLLLIRPDRPCNESLHGRTGDRQPRWTEVVAEKIEAALDSPDERFVGMFVEPERGEYLVEDADRLAEPPAGQGDFGTPMIPHAGRCFSNPPRELQESWVSSTCFVISTSAVETGLEGNLGLPSSLDLGGRYNSDP